MWKSWVDKMAIKAKKGVERDEEIVALLRSIGELLPPLDRCDDIHKMKNHAGACKEETKYHDVQQDWCHVSRIEMRTITRYQ